MGSTSLRSAQSQLLHLTSETKLRVCRLTVRAAAPLFPPDAVHETQPFVFYSKPATQEELLPIQPRAGTPPGCPHWPGAQRRPSPVSGPTGRGAPGPHLRGILGVSGPGPDTGNLDGRLLSGHSSSPSPPTGFLHRTLSYQPGHGPFQNVLATYLFTPRTHDHMQITYLCTQRHMRTSCTYTSHVCRERSERPDLANNSTEHPVTFEFQINNKLC